MVSHIIESDEWDPESINDFENFTLLLDLFYRIYVYSKHLCGILEVKCAK